MSSTVTRRAIGAACAALLLTMGFVARGAVLKQSAGAPTRTWMASSNDAYSFSQFGDAGTWHTIPGAKLNVTVPDGTNAVLLMRFSAESSCDSLSYSEGSASPAAGHCPVRIVVNGTPAQPASGRDFSFDSTSMGNENAGSWEAHSMERWFFTNPGTYTVKVQATVDSDIGAETVRFRLDDWILVVERLKK